MAEIKGHLIICHRCNIATFTKMGEYDSVVLPNDWHRVHFGTCLQDYHLCKDCYEQFEFAKRAFFSDAARDRFGVIVGVDYGK